MIRLSAIACLLLLPACAVGPAMPDRPYQRPANLGRYQVPEYLQPQPTPRIPPVDACRSQLYQGLVGRPEGSIYIPGLPNPKRILKPAIDEGFEYSEQDPLGMDPTLVEVREYLAGQNLYAPSIRTVSDLVSLGPSQQDRLTIELDQYGMVQEVRCD